MKEAGKRPDQITLSLDDSLFSAELHDGAHVIVPVDGERIELASALARVRARLEWDELRPRLERSFEGGGTIVDLFEVVDRTRLLVTRTVELERRKNLRLVFVYRRGSGRASHNADRGDR